MPKLTKRFVDALRHESYGRDVTFFDDELAGFGLRMKPSGVKTWLIQYRNTEGKSRRFKIGGVGAITPQEARERARKALSRAADGKDPDEHKAVRRGITVAKLCDEYLEAEKGRIKASTLNMDRSRIDRHVKPLLGTRAVAGLTPADMEKFLHDVIEGKTAPKATRQDGKHKRARGGQTTGGPGAASRTLGMLGTILQRAVRDGVLPSNPVRGVKRPKDQPRQPPFSFETIAAVGAAMRVIESEARDDAFSAQIATETGLRALQFLITTGCRRMEALTLQWDMVDSHARCLRFKDTKSGKQIRPIGRCVVDFLASFRPNTAAPTDYVFPGNSKAGHFVGLPKAWARVASRAKISDVSLHGLRHWFASAAAEMNYSELTIAGLLGHRVKGITARYATAPDSALLAAADRVSARLLDALEGKDTGTATVVNIGGQRA
jgi:integrase